MDQNQGSEVATESDHFNVLWPLSQNISSDQATIEPLPDLLDTATDCVKYASIVISITLPPFNLYTDTFKEYLISI